MIADLVREFGPEIGVPLAVLWWLGRRLDRAMDDVKDLYQDEIQHLRDRNERLLDRLIGSTSPPPSDAIDVRTLRRESKGRLSQGDLFEDE